jgi:hypothetical protein
METNDLNIRVVGTEDVVEEFDYDIEAIGLPVKVGLKYISEKDIRKINKKASKKRWRGGRKETEVDNEIYNLIFMRESLVYIKGLTWNGLKYLIEKNVKLAIEGVKLDSEITEKQFSEVKEIIVQHVNWKFFNFCFDRSRDVIDEERDEEEAETENL